MDSVLKEVLLDPKKIATQKTLDFGEEFNNANTIIMNQLEQAKEKAESFEAYLPTKALIQRL